MHAFASFNQKILTPGEIKLHAISPAALYGKGIFTTIAVYNEKPFLWEKHWKRLNENAATTGINLQDFSEEIVKNALAKIVEQNRVENARARITFFDESASGIWPLETDRHTSLLITTADLRETKDLNLTVSPYPVNSRSPLANVKSCNYLENILALENAKKLGFDEAVRINERGEIASACLANLFWVKGERIFTPTLATGCLAGTTREFLLENFSIEEKTAALEELDEADEIFLTSAGIGIKNAVEIDGKVFSSSITKELRAKMSAAPA